MDIKDYKQFDNYSPEYQEIIQHSRDLKNQYSQRDAMFQLYEDMYNMNWKHDLRRKRAAETNNLTDSPE